MEEARDHLGYKVKQPPRASQSSDETLRRVAGDLSTSPKSREVAKPSMSYWNPSYRECPVNRVTYTSFSTCGNIPASMERKTSPDRELLERLKHALASDPTNVDSANRYWKALGVRQSGRDVIETFRAAALASRDGVIAFAHAYRELSENSGEAPRLAFFDKELLRTLEASVASLPQREQHILHWVLQSVGSSGI